MVSNTAIALNKKALELVSSGDAMQALSLYEDALRLHPDSAELLDNMGTALRLIGRLQDALLVHERAIRLKPALVTARNNMALALVEVGRIEEAIKHWLVALSMAPWRAELNRNLGLALHRVGRVAQASRQFERELAISSPDAAFELAISQLDRGLWASGFALYHARFLRSEQAVKLPALTAAFWQGERNEQGHLLLWGEQGLGDQLLFVGALAKAVKQYGGKVTLACHPSLMGLFARSFPNVMLRSWHNLPSTSEQLPLASLPDCLALGAPLSPAPYLSVDPDRLAFWGERLRSGNDLRIGLVWASGEYGNQAEKSLPLRELAPIFTLPKVRCYSLQLGAATSEVAEFSHVHDLAPHIHDFDDSAAIVCNLDLVICVDTAMAHLCGALGVPVWVLRAARPEWRFPVLATEQNPWYGSARVFAREAGEGHWSGAVQRVVTALRQLPTKPALLRSGKRQLFAGNGRAIQQWCEQLYRSYGNDVPLLVQASELARAAGQPKLAAQLASRALHFSARYFPARMALANAWQALGRGDAARNLYRSLLQEDANNVAIWNNLGVVFREQGQLDEAEACYRKALALAPDYAPGWGNLGNTLREAGKIAESLVAYQQALRLNPGNAEFYYGVGNSFKAANRCQQAIEAYDHALALAPRHRDAQVNKSLMLLLSGQLQQGWALYQQRFFRAKSPVPTPGLALPWWRGEAAADMQLWLWGEQGAGDHLMFVSLLAEAVPLFRGITMSCPARLLGLFRRSFSQVRFVSDKNQGVSVMAEAELQLPLLDLARYLRPTLAAFRQHPQAYLQADTAKREYWRGQLSSYAGLRVGLVWAGSPTHQNDRNRSLPLSAFAPLLAMNGVSWFSLQLGQAAQQCAAYPVRDCSAELGSYDDTAALVSELDMVIAVDTSVAHLAAALGKPVWVLIPFEPDWRWMLSFADSTPWYASMRLFRQPEAGNWQVPLQAIEAALQQDLAAPK